MTAQENSRIECVVARYTEDVSWTRALACPVLVYDKSGAPGPLALPNIGRETHTYLTHIVRRYPEFPDYTVFVQADPFPHLPEGMDAAGLWERIVQNVRLGVSFAGLAWFKLRCDRLGRPHDMAGSEKEGKWAGLSRDIPVGDVYAALFPGPVPEIFLTPAPAGLFMVARERILARPLGLYRAALALVEADPEDARNTGHAFERLWNVIFNGNRDLNRPEWAD
ncbi:DUF3431 domain-containing protein [Desulfolutivibrio sulfoxidireducens]|uniref:DUF3431 domain-containing protein n=1 Tax=Desulfolutivibrio sulfoxidireducens TaxID=2773299 RepID=UPI001FEC8E57|nr:DUF3431 domain-containing protein [Desulfolutivibrio sulfoxidireducens]